MCHGFRAVTVCFPVNETQDGYAKTSSLHLLPSKNCEMPTPQFACQAACGSVYPMALKRFDTITLDRSKAVKLDNGMMRVPARIARVGVQDYRKADGTLERALRPEAEVFAPEAMASFELLPITNDHPYREGGAVTSENASRLVKGSVGNIKREGDYLVGDALLYDEATLNSIANGRQQVSAGYFTERDETPGEFRGQKYDFVQRVIRGNHVAIVDTGRAGPDVRLLLDSSAAVAVTDAEKNQGTSPNEDKPKMEKITIDGLEVEVSPLAAQVIAKREGFIATATASSEKALAEAKANLDKKTAQCDSAEAKIAALEVELKAVPAKVRAELTERVALEAQAKAIGAEFKADASQDEIKRAVVAKLSPALKLDGKSADYVGAAFDLAVTEHSKKNPATEAVQKALDEKGNPQPITDKAEDPKSEMLKSFFAPKQ